MTRKFAARSATLMSVISIGFGIGLVAFAPASQADNKPDIISARGWKAGPRTFCEGPGARFVPMSRHLILDKGEVYFKSGEISGAYPYSIQMRQGSKTFTLRPLTNPPNGVNYVLDTEESGVALHPVPMLCIGAER